MGERKYYLVSQDLGVLFAAWAKQSDFRIPNKNYFSDLSKGIAYDLQLIFDNEEKNIEIRVVFFEQIFFKLREIITKITGNLIISLDKVYSSGNFQLEINRAVCKKGEVWFDSGEYNRPGYQTIDQQFDMIGHEVNGNSVIVVDDGCWSGKSISRTVKELQMRNIKVDKALVGIFIDSGKTLLDIPLESAFHFPVDSIIDWICERDFLPGAPYGGRTVLVDDFCKIPEGSYGAYYLWGMGDYVDWASLKLDENLVKWFTGRCILRAINLFGIIERFSKKPVLMNNLSRFPYGMEFRQDERFVDVLRKKLQQLGI